MGNSKLLTLASQPSQHSSISAARALYLSKSKEDLFEFLNFSVQVRLHTKSYQYMYNLCPSGLLHQLLYCTTCFTAPTVNTSTLFTGNSHTLLVVDTSCSSQGDLPSLYMLSCSKRHGGLFLQKTLQTALKFVELQSCSFFKLLSDTLMALIRVEKVRLNECDTK